MGYDSQRAFSDVFIPEIKTILGGFLVKTAPAHEDRAHATDLILSLGDTRIACRMRTHRYWLRYRDEFTIRGPRGGDGTELPKIAAGWGDLMFYGFACPDAARVYAWTLADLKAFRLAIHQDPALVARTIDNGDGTCFYPFRWDSFPGAFIVGRGGPWPVPKTQAQGVLPFGS